MATTYESFLEEERKRQKALADAANYEATTAAQEEIRKTLSENAALREKTQSEFDKAIADTESAYDKQYDANAVSSLVAQKNVSEQMANLGLSGSGLDESNRTRIEVATGNANARTARNKQAAIDTLNQQLLSWQTENRDALRTYMTDTETALQDTIRKNNEAAESAAEQAATTRWNDYVTAENERVTAAQNEANETITVLLDLGIMPAESIISASSMSPEHVAALYAQAQQKRADKAVEDYIAAGQYPPADLVEASSYNQGQVNAGVSATIAKNSKSSSGSPSPSNDPEGSAVITPSAVSSRVKSMLGEDYTYEDIARYLISTGLPESDQRDIAVLYGIEPEWSNLNVDAPEIGETVTVTEEDEGRARRFGISLKSSIDNGRGTPESALNAIVERYGNPEEGTPEYILAMTAAMAAGIAV